MQTAIAEATRYNRETPPQGVAENTAEQQSQGEPHNSRVEPQQANSG